MAEPDRPEEAEASSTEAIVPVAPAALDEGARQRKRTLILARSALLAGLCRFVPIPLLDDYLEQNVVRFMVASLLKLEDRRYHVTHVEPLYGGVGDLLSGCLGWVIGLPVRLILKLLKKLFRSLLVFLIIREAAMSMSKALLLGHVIHRHLSSGGLQGKEDDPVATGLLEESTLLRKAFDAAFKGTDLQMLSHLLGTVFTQVKALRRGGSQVVRKMFGKSYEASDRPGEVPERERSAVEQGVEEIEEALEREQVKGFLDAFEKTFQSALAHQRHLAAETRATLPGAGDAES